MTASEGMGGTSIPLRVLDDNLRAEAAVPPDPVSTAPVTIATGRFVNTMLPIDA